MSTESGQRDIQPCIIPAGDEPRRRAAALQCNPAVAGLAILIAVAIMGAAEIQEHETGIFQALRGAAAGALTLAVLVTLHAMARWVTAQDAPREPVPPVTALADEAADITSWLSDADREAMAADADALRDGQLDLAFTAGGNLFELDDRQAEDDEARP